MSDPGSTGDLGAGTTVDARESRRPSGETTADMNRTRVLPSGRTEPAAGLSGDRQRYQPSRSLGKGGMGEVSLVRDLDIERWVAIKRLLPEQTSPAAVARFVEEVQTVGQLEHPNIVPVHDVGVDAEGRYYFVMKYADGEALDAIIAKLRDGDAATHRRFSIAARVLIFRELVRAVSHAHRHGIVHRDIKPANVVIGAKSEVMLMDWGVAKRIREAPQRTANAGSQPGAMPTAPKPVRLTETLEGGLVGTPLYMSPEQARGADADERSDIYSLGALFYELLALHHYLSPKKDMQELLRGVEHEMPLNPRSLPQKNPSIVPHAFCVIVLKMLAKDPKDRFQSAEALLGALDVAIEGRPECYWECPPAVIDHALGRIRGALWSKAGDFVNILFWFAGALMVYGAYRLASDLDSRVLVWMAAIATGLIVWTIVGNVRPSIVSLKRNLRNGFAAQPNLLGIGKKR